MNYALLTQMVMTTLKNAYDPITKGRVPIKRSNVIIWRWSFYTRGIDTRSSGYCTNGTFHLFLILVLLHEFIGFVKQRE